MKQLLLLRRYFEVHEKIGENCTRYSETERETVLIQKSSHILLDGEEKRKKTWWEICALLKMETIVSAALMFPSNKHTTPADA